MKTGIFVSGFSLFVLFSGCVPRDAPNLGQNNAVWSEGIYFRGYRASTGEMLTDARVIDYANTLKRFKVKYAYIFAGPYGHDGRLPSFAFSQVAINSVRLIKDKYPDVVILPWLGGIQNKTVFLGDSSWVRNALSDTNKIIQVLGVPGVHIDFEFIIQGDQYLDTTIGPQQPGDYENYANNVNNFHRKLRSILPDAFISSVVTATSPGTRPWKRKTTVSELNVLLQYVDQISFLYYDTQISQQAIFEANCKSLLKDIALLKSQSGHREVQYLVAIGTFVNIPELQKYRNLQTESIKNTLSVLRNAQEAIDSKHNLIDGIAIFCDWETDLSEWQDFYEFWAVFGN